MPPIDLERCSDEELLELANEDARAFGIFYDRYEDAILGYFHRATRRADLAADLTAEVFALALASLGAFRSELGSARKWLFGIAHHELLQTWRRGRVEAQARERLHMEALMLGDDDIARIDELDEVASLDPLRLLADLPPDQRAAVAGRILNEHNYRELATELTCSELVVRQRVSRGLRTLRARMANQR